MSENSTSGVQKGFFFSFSHTNLQLVLRNALILFIYLILFTILDWLSRAFQVYPNVVSWYPAHGLSFALVLVLGGQFAPALVLTSLISSFLIYKIPIPVELVLGWGILVSIIYGGTAVFLRRRIRFDPQLKSIRDVIWLILSSGMVSAILSIVAVSADTSIGVVSPADEINAMFIWWLSETVGILMVTPVLLIYIMPWVKQFSNGDIHLALKPLSLPRPPKNLLGQIIGVLITFYLAFEEPALIPFHPYYLIAIPLIWIALDYGIKGASLGIFVINFGAAFTWQLLRHDLVELSELQFIMLAFFIVSLLVGVVRTQQMQAEDKVRKNEKRFRALIENSADGITLLDTNGITIYDSPAAARMLGYAADELIGRNVFELIHAEDLPKVLVLFQDIVKSFNSRISSIFRFRHKDGSWRWLEAMATNLLDEPAVKAIVVNYRDITNRKTAEEAVLKSETHFHTLFEDSPISLWEEDFSAIKLKIDLLRNQGITDFKAYFSSHPEVVVDCFKLLRILDINKVGLELYGAKSKEDLFINLENIQSQEWLEHFQDELVTIAEGRTGYTREGTDKTLIGERIDFRINWSVVSGYEDNYSKVIVSIVNLTESKRAEEKILSLSRFPAENPNPILRLTPDGMILYANQASTVLLDFWERKVNQFLPDEWQKQVVEVFTSGLNKEVEIECAEQIFSCILAPIREEGYVNFYGRDITERKRAELALSEAKNRYRLLVERLPAVTYIISSEAPYNTLYISPQIEQVLGFTPEEWLTDPDIWERQIYPEDRKRVLAEDIASREENMPFVCEYRIFRRDGQLIWLHDETYHIHEPGMQPYSQGIEFDITERKQAEEEIQSRTGELSTLYGLSRALADADDLDKILELISRHAVESIHSTFARIMLLEGNKFVARAVYPVRFMGHDFLVGNREQITALPYCQRVLEQNEPVILHSNNQDITREERTVLLLDFAQSLCLVPLRIGGPVPASRQVLGLLILGEERNEKREPFTPDKLRLAQSIGDQAAIAIRRRLLHEQTERRLEHLSALREIDQVIASSIGLHLSLGALLSQVNQQLKVDASAVWIFNSVSNMLVYSAGRGFRSKAFEQAKPHRLGEGYVGRVALDRRIIHIPNLATQDDNPRLMRALENERFISYYGVPLIAKGTIKGVLEVFHRTPLEPDEEWLDFLNTLAGQGAIAIDNSTMFENLQRSKDELSIAYDETIEGWSRALDLRDKETEGHTQRVTETTIKLARLFGLNEEAIIQVRRGALLHDIGKMGVPDGILLKPGPLTADEWVIMRQHPQFTFDMLSPIYYLKSALDIPYCHHEKWDGTGYPNGLKGEEIPLEARIFAVVDVWDALTSDRPYRPAWPEKKVLEHIQSLAGTHFDPQVVEVCFKSGILVSKH